MQKIKKIKKSTIVILMVVTVCVAVFYASWAKLGAVYFTNGDEMPGDAMNTGVKNTGQSSENAPAPAYEYILKEINGKLGVFSWESETLIRETDIITGLLPQYDQIQLKTGIKLKDDAELRKLLEDFGE